MTLQTTLDALWDNRADFDARDPAMRGPVEEAIGLLDSGAARVAEPGADGVAARGR